MTLSKVLFLLHSRLLFSFESFSGMDSLVCSQVFDSRISSKDIKLNLIKSDIWKYYFSSMPKNANENAATGAPVTDGSDKLDFINL